MMKKGIFPILLIILLIIGVIVTVHSSYFAITEIKISGIKQLAKDEIIQVLGDLEGQNIFLIPGRELVNKLLTLERIKGAKLERELPHTLSIQIKERSSLGLFKDKSHRWVEVSDDGQVLQIYGEESLPKIPKIYGFEVSLAKNLVEMGDELSHLLTVLQALSPFHWMITEVRYDPKDIQVFFETKTTLYLGPAVSALKRVPIFLTILQSDNFALGEIEYIDLRYEGKPVIRLREKN